LSEDVVNRILQVILDLQHFKSSLLILAATILQISSAIHHLSNIDNMYIKSYSFSLFSSLPGVLTPVRGESLKILNGFDVSLPVSHSLWSSQSFGHQKAINGFDMPLPVAVCSGLVNPLAPRKGEIIMDPNTSIGRLCLGVDDHVSLNDGFESEGQWEGLEYHDTTESGRKKETKAFTFYRMETEEIGEQYITLCFMDGLHAYDGEINLEYEKNMISNEFAIKLCLDYEEKEGEKVMKKELLVALRGELYFVKFIINPEEDDVEPRVVDEELDNLLASINVTDLPPLDVTDIPPFMCRPSFTVKRPLTQEEVSREELENNIYERILILNEPRPIIETLKYSDQHKKLVDSVLLDKLKLDEKWKLKKKQLRKRLSEITRLLKKKRSWSICSTHSLGGKI
ncbi:hypothetical protein Tco_0950521, partial [Tanacetum coccineum]